MYIRWIVRKHKNAHALHMKFHDAYLVQSYRDQKGNPRQRTLAYLGNMREMDDEFPGIERELFLLRARRVLDNLSELSEDDHKDVLDLLQQVAPPLSHEEIKRAFHQNLYWYIHSCHTLGNPLPTAAELDSLIESTKEEFLLNAALVNPNQVAELV